MYDKIHHKLKKNNNNKKKKFCLSSTALSTKIGSSQGSTEKLNPLDMCKFI